MIDWLINNQEDEEEKDGGDDDDEDVDCNNDQRSQCLYQPRLHPYTDPPPQITTIYENGFKTAVHFFRDPCMPVRSTYISQWVVALVRVPRELYGRWAAGVYAIHNAVIALDRNG